MHGNVRRWLDSQAPAELVPAGRRSARDGPAIHNGRMNETLWVLEKDGHTMTCTISGEHGHEELQVLYDQEIYLSEAHTVDEGAASRAELLRHGFERRGWAAKPEGRSNSA